MIAEDCEQESSVGGKGEKAKQELQVIYCSLSLERDSVHYFATTQKG